MLCFAANDCGEDERYCTIDNKCIPGFFWCDAYSVPDCTDGEDEKDCSGMCIYPAMTAFTDQYSLPNIFFDIGQL